MKFSTSLLSCILICLLASSCNTKNSTVDTSAKSVTESKPKFQNKGHELVYNMVQKVGTYSDLAEKKDVIYTYTYKTPDGKTDISNEKYIFDGELSYGSYNTHERTHADLEGLVEQGYDGKSYWLKNNGTYLDDEGMLKRVAFNRPTNFYWFAMFQKLLDPNLNYEYISEKNIDSKKYDVVKVSFESKDNKPKDIYQLYINQKTGLVDQFLFTVADFGLMDPKLMQLEYEKVNDLLIPTQRKYKNSTWDAEVTEEPWIHVTWSDIKFNNGLTSKVFQKS